MAGWGTVVRGDGLLRTGGRAAVHRGRRRARGRLGAAAGKARDHNAGDVRRWRRRWDLEAAVSLVGAWWGSGGRVSGWGVGGGGAAGWGRGGGCVAVGGGRWEIEGGWAFFISVVTARLGSSETSPSGPIQRLAVIQITILIP